MKTNDFYAKRNFGTEQNSIKVRYFKCLYFLIYLSIYYSQEKDKINIDRTCLISILLAFL